MIQRLNVKGVPSKSKISFSPIKEMSKEDRNQAVRKIAKKRAHRSDWTLDRTLEESDRTLRSRGSAIGATGRWRQIDRTQDSRVRSSTERFQSGETTTRRIWWQVTGRWQCPISCSWLQRSGRPDASGQDVISVWSVAEKRDFIPNGYFLSGACKYNPNRPNE